jgi:1A family penicillin-binding protein
MAKKSRRKIKKRVAREQAQFFESLPMASPMPTVMPMPEIPFDQGVDLAKDIFRAGASDAKEVAQAIWRKLRSKGAKRAYISLILFGTITTAVVGSIIAASTLSLFASDISSPAALMAKKKTGITILDRNGVQLYRGYGATGGQSIPLDKLPSNLKNATLAAEDPSFYDHSGFSFKGTARAIYVDTVQRNKAEGGSTITQQLVKNALLSSEKSYVRKYREILLAIAIEQKYSKDQILDMYLNEVYYGEGASGVEAASETYFHKPAKDLTLSQSAMLAGLPLGPSRLDPAMHPKAAKARRDFVLDKMVGLGKISSAEAYNAKAEPIEAFSKDIVIRAPHFVFYVLDQLREKYGEDIIEQGGMTVTTSLDINKQDAAQAIVAKRINDLSSHHVTNGGLVSMDTKTGDIMAMVGSYDYNAAGFGNVNVTLSQLQPGSSFKPFAYVTAFAKGWTGVTKVDDSPLTLPNGDGTLYKPMNYDLKFRGQVTLRRALANSLNIPAIKVLQFATIPDTLNTAKSLGLGTLKNPNDYGLSLVLGAGNVRPLDMAAAYSGFATGGYKVTPRSILKVTDRQGKTIMEASSAAHPKVLDSRYVAMLTSILSDNKARTEEFGANSPLKLSRPAAAKTGTTNDFRDNWTVGYTPSVATAVWVGNNDHSAMENVDGITGAAPIWHDYMEMALNGTPVEQFTLPAGVVTDHVCTFDGGLANIGDSSAIEEVFLAEARPTKSCSFKPTPSPAPTPTPSETPPPDKKDQAVASPSPNPSSGGMGSGNDPAPTPMSPTP